MDDCCSPAEGEAARPKKRRCPVNGREYAEVSARTIAQHIRHSWNWSGKNRHYYFCNDPDCDVVYFGDDDSVIPKSQLRTGVGVKDAADDAMLCYCFGVTKADARGDPGIRKFVMAQTKLGLCACEIRNPSGRCCLPDFPRDG